MVCGVCVCVWCVCVCLCVFVCMMRAVVLEELTDEEDRTISVPEVETLILRCGQAGNQQVQWTWSEGNLNSTCFTVSVFGGEVYMLSR